MRNKQLEDKVFGISTRDEFEMTALEIFQFQLENNPVYNEYVTQLNRGVNSYQEIPFLPIDFFKTHAVKTKSNESDLVFTSSGTTGSTQSRHYIQHKDVYEKSFKKCFESFYGPISGYRILALLPSYLERTGSSLVYMTQKLIEWTGNMDSGFYLDDFQALKGMLEKGTDKTTLLIGVSFGLLDFLEFSKLKLHNTIVMETGGMKGRRKEMIREELHDLLKEGFGVSEIHSEYGMTELLSQAYSKKNGYFNCPPWMEIRIRQANDPFSYSEPNRSGGINVTDLANLYSCSFIATSDLGKRNDDGTYSILGRFDFSDIRGCNLMLSH